MKRRLYKGPFYPALEEAFLMELGSIESRPLDLVRIIAPSRLLRRRLRGIIVERLGGRGGVELMDFNNLSALGFGPELERRRLSPLPRGGGELLAAMALDTLKPADRFHKLADKPGFRAALLATIADLKEARVSPADLERALDQLPDDKLPDKPKIAELARLFAEYERLKGRARLCDEKDLFSLAVDYFNENPRRHETPVFIHGFYDLTNLQGELLMAYLGEGDGVATVPWWEDTAEFCEPCLSFLREAGFVEAALAGGVENAGKFPSSTSLFSAPGETREAREAARALIGYCVEKGVKLDEAAVVVRQPEQYLDAFRECLESAGVPYHMPDGQKLTSTPAGKALSYLVELCEAKFSRRSVMRFLEGAPLKPDKNGNLPEVERWGRLAREAGVIEGRDEWRAALAALKNKRRHSIDYDDELDDKGIESGRADLNRIDDCVAYMDDLFRGIESLPGEGEWSDYSGPLNALFDRFVDSRAEGFAPAVAIIRSLAGLGDIKERTDRTGALTVLKDALESEKITPRKSVGHGVTVADIMLARCAPFRVVVVPGLVERGFPRIVRQDPLLLDGERKALNEFMGKRGLCGIDIKRRGRVEEKMLFNLARSAAIDRLILTYPRMDPVSGGERLPSTFFIRAAEEQRGRSLGIKNLSAFRRAPLAAPFPDRPSDALSELEYHLASCHNLLKGKKAGALMYLADDRVSRFFGNSVAAEEARWGRRTFTVYDGVFKSKEAKKALVDGGHTLDDRPLSARRLQGYASCPHRYFMEEILDVVAPEDPERLETMDPLDKGSMLHELLRRFFTRLRDEGLLPVRKAKTDKANTILEEIAGEVFRQFEDRPVGWPLMWKLARRRVMENMEALLARERADENWTPRYFEVRFGYSKKGRDEDPELSRDEPAKVSLGEKYSVRLRGKIDRIDLSRDGQSARIIDYKSGSGDKYANDRLKGGELLQLPLYSLAASSLLPGKAVSAAEYWLIERGATVKHFNRMGDETLSRQLEIIVRTIIDGAREGLFFQFKGDACRHCDVKRTCGGVADVLYERKKDDPRVRQWRAMKDIS